MYAVLLETGAERDLDRLDPPALNRVIKHIRELGAGPRPAGCRKLYGGSSEWRIRVGDYRVVYEVDDRSREVRVLRVRHRRDVYR